MLVSTSVVLDAHGYVSLSPVLVLSGVSVHVPSLSSCVRCPVLVWCTVCCIVLYYAYAGLNVCVGCQLL